MDDHWEAEATLSEWLQALNTPSSYLHFGFNYAHVSLIIFTHILTYIIFNFYFINLYYLLMQSTMQVSVDSMTLAIYGNLRNDPFFNFAY